MARWLRTLGYDTAFDPEIADAALVRRALEEGRQILTRDAGLLEAWRVEGMLVEADKPLEQLTEVVRTFELPRPRRLFTRCRACNAELERVSLEEVADRVPGGAKAAMEDGAALARCPGCGRVYWEGSHTARMRAEVDAIFGER